MRQRQNNKVILLVLGVIAALLITNVATFFITYEIQLKQGDKVIVNLDEYEELVDSYNKYSKVEYLQGFLHENYLKDVTDEELMNGVYRGIFESLDDPYSVYMTKEEFNDFMEQTEGSYGGIGVIVTPGDDNYITVVSPIEDTPGERAGIKPDDKIVKVNDKEFTADQMSDAVKIMKGEPGTDVKVTILRKDKNNNNKFIDVNITREEIKLVTVKSQMLEDKIGYIRITSFDRETYDDFKKNLTSLQKDGMNGLIIDLRNNPGGLLDQCAKIADELMGKSVIVYTETKNKEREYLNSDKGKIDVPLVILVNGGSASASEILSGAVKDTDSGVLIGTKTFGKGIVQRINPMSDGSGFKFTVSEYFTPSGVNIHGVGIEPNIEVELPEDIEEFGVNNIDNDTQLQKGIEVIKERMK
ncbi:S41 family peptidase [Sporosalibacterium faouarense]|uniref:S41 family peptidase n=1 Tax=Sporosalibacterium faouarense TaxID=516123 RepID=UPI00141C573A|nr:S41 family peptidase [Sporosalibacterium faouarense]MTI47333.1 S41 family peptidase [Bacillota bacterium]